MAGEELLRDAFYTYPSMEPCMLLLTERKLVVKYTKAKSEFLQEVDLSEIVGCQSVYKNEEKTDTSSYLRIFFYPLKTVGGILNKQFRRERVVLKFAMKKFLTYPENAAIVSVWKRAILWLVRGKQLFFNKEVHIPASLPDVQRHLVVVNPHSGSGKALQIFREQVVPLFDESETEYELLITDKPNHARSYMKSMDLSLWTGIVVVSGDGLIFEVFNGLMERKDWETAIKTPVGVIPGGSGNGLAMAINYAVGEPCDPTSVISSVLNVVRGRLTPMDLVRVETLRGDPVYSFLSIGWGLMADIDIESEKLRSIGEARFTVWAVIRALGLRKYKGKLSYLPVAGYESAHKVTVETKAKRSKTFDFHSSGHYELANEHADGELMSRSKSFGAETSQIPTHNGDNSVKLIQFSYSDSCTNSQVPSIVNNNTSVLNAVVNNGAVSDNSGQFRSERFIGTKDSKLNGNNVTAKAPQYTQQLSTLPSLDEPVPQNWIVIEGEFVLVYVCHQTHLSATVFFSPEAKLDDGIMWLVMMRSGVSRAQVIYFLSSLQTGDHVNIPYVDVIPIHAFRLEPFQDGGVLTVDGEAIPCGAIQAEVLPSISRIMTR